MWVQVSGVSRVWGVGCRVWGAGCKVWSVVCRVKGVGCKVQVVGCRVQVVGCRVQVVGCRVQCWKHLGHGRRRAAVRLLEWGWRAARNLLLERLWGLRVKG